MTYLELKAEAAKLGYDLVKKPRIVKMLNCPCGVRSGFVHMTSRRRYYLDDDMEPNLYIQCRRCGRRVYLGMSRAELVNPTTGHWLYNNAELENMTREKWNEAVEKGLI